MTDVNIKSTPESVYGTPGIAANTFTVMMAQTGVCRLVYGESTPERNFIPRGAISLHIVDLLALKRIIEDTENKYKSMVSNTANPAPKTDPATEEFLKSMKQETSKVKE